MTPCRRTIQTLIRPRRNLEPASAETARLRVVSRLVQPRWIVPAGHDIGELGLTTPDGKLCSTPPKSSLMPWASTSQIHTGEHTGAANLVTPKSSMRPLVSLSSASAEVMPSIMTSSTRPL
jgi:hypothetical protein